MAYTLRYYKTLPQPGERDIILEIYEKDGSGVSMEIGPVVQSLHLDIQGSQDDIDTPIIKTSLVMSFVDAPDHEEASSRKCGDWSEFYTPDSTYWKVVLKARDNSGTFSPIWGGYVTPDSFSEQLRYRGSVTIVARDNIGHLQDFPFDATGNEDGMITVYDLVNAAWAKIESPMSLDWRGDADGALWLQCEGTDAPSTYVNVSAFEEKNWYEAVESILYSMGMTMRYIGINIVQVASLRYMQYQGREDLSDLPRIEPKFIAYANRELAPAARRIEESVKYDLTDGKLAPLADGVLFSGVQYTSPFISENVFGEQTTYNIPVWPIANTGDLGWSNIPSSTLFLDPGRYNLSGDDLIDDAERMLFIAGNTGDSRAVTYGQRMACKDFRIEMRFGRVVERFNSTSLGYAWFVWPSKFRGYVSVEQNGITQFYTGSGWQTEAFLLEIDIEEGMIAIDVPIADFAGSAVVKLTIQEIALGWKIGDVSDGQGLYVAISSLRFASVESSMLETNRVNTNYDESNNVIISRNPAFAPAYNEVPFPQIIKNGIFLLRDSAYVPAKGWSWPGGTPQQMAVYNHLQLLCYYAKPNNVITGDIVNANLGDIRALYLWHGREHLLQGGSLNFLNGRIEGAILREFTRYESIWGDVTGDSGLPDVEQSSGTTAESSSSPSSDGYDINTEVYLGGGGGGGTSITIDTEMSDSSRNAVENRVIKAYVDGNVAMLQEEIDTKAEARIIHIAAEIGSILTDEQKAYNAETYQKIAAGEKMLIQIVFGNEIIVPTTIAYGNGVATLERTKMDDSKNGETVTATLREDGTSSIIYHLLSFPTVDREMSDYSYNAIANAVVKQYIDDEIVKAKPVYDIGISDTSENAVQNKVIKEYIDALLGNAPLYTLYDISAIVNTPDAIDDIARLRLYDLIGYTEGGEIPTGSYWFIDTNGLHYVINAIDYGNGTPVIMILGNEGYTIIFPDNTKQNELIADKTTLDDVKAYTDGNFFSQAQFDPAKTHDYVKHYIHYDDEAPKTLEIGVDLRIKDDIANAAEDDLDNGDFNNGLVTALGVKQYVEAKIEEGGGGATIPNISFAIDPTTMELIMTYEELGDTLGFHIDDNGNLIATLT